MDWDDVRSWTGEDLRREVLYVRSGDADVFVSLYGPVDKRPGFGLLVCPAWGFEGTTSRELQMGLAAAAAEHGGLGVAFHYPGHDDSTGDVAGATIEVMTRAAVDCARSVADRFDGRWILAGIRLGASVAALAARELRPARLLYISGALDPAAYFEDLTRRARRASLAYPGSKGVVFGVPLSDTVLRTSADTVEDVAVSADGLPATSIRYADERESRAGDITVDGTGDWLTRSRHESVVSAAATWLEESAS